MATTLINDYEIMYSANAFPPRIWLLNSGKFIGQLIFHPDGAALPPDGMSGGQVNLQYHLEDFETAPPYCATRKPFTCFTMVQALDLKTASRPPKRSPVPNKDDS